jgi:hypothetical protein
MGHGLLVMGPDPLLPSSALLDPYGPLWTPLDPPYPLPGLNHYLSGGGCAGYVVGGCVVGETGNKRHPKSFDFDFGFVKIQPKTIWYIRNGCGNAPGNLVIDKLRDIFVEIVDIHRDNEKNLVSHRRWSKLKKQCLQFPQCFKIYPTCTKLV